MRNDKYIQIGITALRNEDGSFQPSVPLYIRAPADEVDLPTGFTHGEKNMLSESSGIFLDLYRQYVEAGGRKTGD
ncbi:MAG TPA: hypothetical protein DEB31_10470 [Clostridiales bacterium]|nr:hypothetical protein [Clostridiales bacterium]